MNALTMFFCIWAASAFCALAFIRGATRPALQREDGEQRRTSRHAGLFVIHYSDKKLDATAR
jgi:hypothetical protein